MSKTCTNCGTAVSDDFARVCGDNNNEVHHCLECIESEGGNRELLRRGAPAYRDIEVAKQRIEL